jgi:N,N'-diacetyllegionaminate synthase
VPGDRKEIYTRVVAEIGLSHEGSLGAALSFIHNAKKSGADFVKFQMHIADSESSLQETFRTPFTIQDKTRFDYWKRTEFTPNQWEFLIQECRDNEITFCVSVFSSDALKFMIDSGVDHIKLGSGDLTNLELFEVLQNWHGHLILSTGMATWIEISEMMHRYRDFVETSRITIMQCTSMYPTPLELVGINVMEEMQERYGSFIGLSDHSVGINASMVGIVRGASMIEKHVTPSKKMFGPDISSSITFEELEQLCNFRDDFIKVSSKIDKDLVADSLSEQKSIFGRSLGVRRDIKKGELISIEDFCLRKPAGGLSWTERIELLSKPARRNIEKNSLIGRDDFE